MFTGIVQAVGRVAALERSAAGVRIRVDAAALDMADVAPGDSIAVAGCCLTVTELAGDRFAADVSGETLALTNLGQLHEGSAVNLEKSLRLADRLGGHLVSGHVDGVAEVLESIPEGGAQRWAFRVPPALARYLARKGSIALDGTSLTINAVQGDRIEVTLIPHTLAHTSFSERRPGDAVNIEVDMVARYLERLMATEERG